MKLHRIAKTFELNLLLQMALLSTIIGCKSTSINDYYSLDDFPNVKKIDVHAHAFTSQPQFVQQAKEDNFILISVNTEVPGELPVDSQQYYVLHQRLTFPKDIYCVSTFETANINQPGWVEQQLTYIKKAIDSGAVGIKVWKNIGMVIKNPTGNFIMIDNPVFKPIFDYLEQNDIPVIGHIGEPKNCWLPLDEMTTNNDRKYFSNYPEYHMYLHPKYPSYESQILSRDRLLEKHPNLRFIGAHLGSLEWGVDEIAKRLDKFPNMSVEPAERLGHLQYQSIENWQKVHNFFIKYQDRIMYGTDLVAVESEHPDDIKKKAHELWLEDWIYFTTGDSLQSPFVDKKFKGLHLPRTVIDKIYFSNAEKWYRLAGHRPAL